MNFQNGILAGIFIGILGFVLIVILVSPFAPTAYTQKELSSIKTIVCK
jgi:hypothetical protein